MKKQFVVIVACRGPASQKGTPILAEYYWLGVTGWVLLIGMRGICGFYLGNALSLKHHLCFNKGVIFRR